MLERYLLADPTLMEKLALKLLSRKAETGQTTEVKDTRKYLHRWEKEWRELSSWDCDETERLECSIAKDSAMVGDDSGLNTPAEKPGLVGQRAQA